MRARESEMFAPGKTPCPVDRFGPNICAVAVNERNITATVTNTMLPTNLLLQFDVCEPVSKRMVSPWDSPASRMKNDKSRGAFNQTYLFLQACLERFHFVHRVLHLR